MKNTGLDTHRSFQIPKYNSSRPSLYNNYELANSSYRTNVQYEKFDKIVLSTHKTGYKNYPLYDYVSPNRLIESKYQKSKNHKNGDRKSIAKNMNNSQKVLSKRQQITSSYKGITKWKNSVDGEARIEIQESRHQIPQSLLYHSNVTQIKQSSRTDLLKPKYQQYKDTISDAPSTKSINGSDVFDKDSGFDNQIPGRQIESYLAKSSAHEQQKYQLSNLKLKSKQSDPNVIKDTSFFDDYSNKKLVYSTKDKLIGYPKIDHIKTQRSHYETGFLKKTQNPSIRARKQTNIFQYSEFKKQDNRSLKLIPKLQKIDDIKHDIAVLSTRHPSLYIPSTDKKITIKDFEVGKSLGHGRFGKVYHAIHKQSGILVALKKIPKQTIKIHKLQNQLTLEIKIQTYLNHPNIVKMYGAISQKQNVYMILEHMQQGSLYESLKKRGKLLAQQQVSNIIKSIVSAIRYLHDLNVVHRDIKPQNILLSNGVCKLADFGWAALCNERRKTNCGTLDYYAPQILQGQDYDETIDLWCIGVLTFELLTGKVPFYHASKKETVNKIIKVQKMDFPSNVSELARDFIEGLLVKEPSKRLNVNKLLNHGFIIKNCDDKC